MQRGNEGRSNSSRSGSPFDLFRDFGTHRSMMSGIFGGRDPFDDPFFSRPFGSSFESSIFGSSISSSGDSPSVNVLKGPVIEELNTDDEDQKEAEDSELNYGDKKDKANRKTVANKDPFVQHPEDLPDERKVTDVANVSDYNKAGVAEPKTQSVSFQRVTYGGINGAYYTATMTRKMGNDGVVLEESRKADKITGQATHRISRGIHDKGHSLTRELDSDGKVDTMQTLHNMNEDELAGFEQAWKGNADRRLPDWNDGFRYHGNTDNYYSCGSMDSRLGRPAWALPITESFSRRTRTANEMRTSSYGGSSKKVVTINIE